MFESDDEAELGEFGEDEDGDDEVKQGTKEEGLLILQTGINDDSYQKVTWPQGSLEEGEDGELMESCHICGEKVLHLDKHILTSHEEEVKCQMCGKTFPVGNLRWHILTEHCQIRNNKCSLCGHNFVDKNTLETHMKENHLSMSLSHAKYVNEIFRKFECSYCMKRFEMKTGLFNHVKSIHLGEKTKCPDCEKEISVDNFTRHVKEFHKKITKPCIHCGKNFGMSNLSKHIREVHTKEKAKCPYCGKACSKSNLSTHIKNKHTKIKQVCEICNDTFPFSTMPIHRKNAHNISKSKLDVRLSEFTLKLKKPRSRNIDKHIEEDVNLQSESFEVVKGKYDIDKGVTEVIEHDDVKKFMNKETVQVGEKIFTFS